jgi:TPR repeat protein
VSGRIGPMAAGALVLACGWAACAGPKDDARPANAPVAAAGSLRSFVLGLADISDAAAAAEARQLAPLAAAGDVQAQTYLALMFEAGKGEPQDYAEAAKWYKKAADQGGVDAEKALSRLYTLGEGVPRDTAEATRLELGAAQAGDAEEQVEMGGLYRSGLYAPKDLDEAVRWFRRAADQGDATRGTRPGRRNWQTCTQAARAFPRTSLRPPGGTKRRPTRTIPSPKGR